VLLIVVALTYDGIQEYWSSIRLFELDAEPRGISLRHLFPRPVAKSVQILSAASMLFALLRCPRPERDAALRSASLPFAAAMMLQGLCFCTIAYEYRAVYLLGLLPIASLWVGNACRVTPRHRAVALASVAGLLMFSLRVYPFLHLLRERGTVLLYLTTSLVLLGLGLRIITGVRQ